MNQAPRNFNGAVDLGALAAAREAQAKAAAQVQNTASSSPQSAQSRQGDELPVVIDVTTATFETAVIEQSRTVPVIIDLWATWCGPCTQLSPILESLAHEYSGRWVLAKVDVDAEKQIAAAFQVQSIPSVFVAIDGQVAPLFQGALPAGQVRQVIEAVLAQAATIGVNGTLASGQVPAKEVAEVSDPRFDAAEAALDSGDWEAAQAAYEQVLRTTPNDSLAKIGLLNVQLLKRTDGIDFDAVLSRDPGESLQDILLYADVQFLMNHYEDAFTRLLAAVRKYSGAERDQARTRLLDLFEVLGPTDPAVVKARSALANALY